MGIQSADLTEADDVSQNLCRVWVVEDNKADIALIRMAIAQAGIPCELKEIRDGAEAVVKLSPDAHPQVDVLLVDLNLPKVNGFSVLRALKRPRAFTVIAMSSSVSSKDRDAALGAGADRFFSKPADLHRFLDEVADALRECWRP